jgi:subtilisin family serine protease
MAFSSHHAARARFGALGALALTALLLGACAEPSTAIDMEVASAQQGLSPSRLQVSASYIVQFAAGERDVPGLAQQLVAAHGGALRFTYTAALEGFAAELPPQAVEALQRNPRVLLIEPDRELQLFTGGTQTSPPSWGLDRIDQRGTTRDGSYTYGNDGSGVHAYIFDTGIRSTHDQFAGRIGAGHTMVFDGNGTEDCHGHGTHVSGTVGGSLHGVAKRVTLHPIRVFGCSGGASTSSIISALDWVVKNGERPAVANMSLGGGFSSAFNTAIENAVSAGITIVVAAGNSTTDACTVSPASAPSAITVGSTASNDAISSFSNRGPCVDLFAPGTSIASAYHTSNTAAATMSGTSMASPHVAGAAVLYLAANPSATPAQVDAALKTNATGNTISALPVNTPNLLLFTTFIGAAGTMPPPEPPPANAVPTADFATACSDLTCNFTDQSADSDGTIASREWSFGDGSVSTVRNPSRTYLTGGTYTVTLTVTDNAGATATTTRSVTVTAPQTTNAAPTAAFTAQCQGNRSSCSFNGSGSSDDKGVVRYDWNFGDGSATRSSNTTSTSYQYSRTGTFTVTLTVFDAEGLSSSTTRSVTVREYW